jgi:glutathione S-transferase
VNGDEHLARAGQRVRQLAVLEDFRAAVATEKAGVQKAAFMVGALYAIESSKVLELYHSVNSVCAQKVRVALAEKGLEYREHLMTLRGDQFSPEYMKLNPNAVVPTLVHDGRPLVESSVILYYLDEAFPEPPLMPQDPRRRAAVRMFNKLIDEYVHNSCTILTFATAFRPWFSGLSGEEIEARLAKSPSKQRTEYKRDVALRGLDSKYVRDAVGYHAKLLRMMDEAPGSPASASRSPMPRSFPTSCGSIS